MFIETLSKIANFVTTTLGTNLFAKVGDLISGITPLITAGLGTYFLLCLLDYYRNGVQDNVIDMTKKFTGWVLLSALVLNSSNYTEIAKAIYETPESLASVFSDSSQKISADMFKTIMDNLNIIGAKMSKLAESLAFWDIYGKGVVGFGQFLIYIAISLLTSISFIYYLIAKINLALVLVVGPLFLGGMFFPATRQYGMNWIGQCLNYIISVVLYTVLVTLMVKFLNEYIATVAKTDAYVLVTVWKIILTTIPMTVLFILALFSVPSISSALTGGATLEMNARKGSSIVRGATQLGNKALSLMSGRKGGSISGQ